MPQPIKSILTCWAWVLLVLSVLGLLRSLWFGGLWVGKLQYLGLSLLLGLALHYYLGSRKSG